jgi:hypothetical protein
MDSIYRLEQRSYHSARLPFVARTYIVTMEGSDRRPSYLAQMHSQPLTEKVIVVHNPGFRQTPKPGVSSTVEDLWHANQFVFQHCADIDAPILVLEDDATLSRLSDAHVAQISDALAENCEALFLGTWPLVSWRHGARIRLGFCAFAHAVVYSRSARDCLLGKSLPRVLGLTIPHDVYVSSSVYACALREPVAFQRHVSTDNAKTWDPLGALRLYFSAWRAHETPEPMTRFHHRLGFVGGAFAIVLGLIVVICAAVGGLRR